MISLFSSADDAIVSTAKRFVVQAFVVQVIPESVDKNRKFPDCLPLGKITTTDSAANFVPSAEDAMPVNEGARPFEGSLVAKNHVIPESAEIQILPSPFTAAIFTPSAELAIEFQFVIGASDSVQSKPELVGK